MKIYLNKISINQLKKEVFVLKRTQKKYGELLLKKFKIKKLVKMKIFKNIKLKH